MPKEGSALREEDFTFIMRAQGRGSIIVEFPCFTATFCRMLVLKVEWWKKQLTGSEVINILVLILVITELDKFGEVMQLLFSPI